MLPRLRPTHCPLFFLPTSHGIFVLFKFNKLNNFYNNYRQSKSAADGAATEWPVLALWMRRRFVRAALTKRKSGFVGTALLFYYFYFGQAI
jgi:hypothetical protein